MRKCVIAFSLLFLTTCSDSKPFESRSTAFDQPLSLEIKGIPAQHAQSAAETIIADLHYLSEAFHPWNPGSLGRTNQLLSMSGEFSANPSIIPVVTAATRLEQQTHGYYAPALGGLQELWGFHSEIPDGPVPDKTAISRLLAAKPNMGDVHIDGIRMRGDNPVVRLDFGAMAQGYALDVARRQMQEKGIDTARLRNGGLTAVVGNGWQAQLPGGIKLLLTKNEAIATLERDEYSFTDDNKNYHPYINPFTGYPSNGLRNISVLHENAADAAAYAQALLNGGKEKLAELLQVIPVEYALAVTDDGQIILSNGLKQRIKTMQQ